jgi:hypothetical protein
MINAPAANAAAVTPHDGTNLSTTTRALWVGGAGDVAVEMLGSGTIVLAGIPAGTLLPIRVTRVNSTNTDATDIVALW